MSAANIPGCFFLDSSVLIPEILAQGNPRIIKLKNEIVKHHIPCYFSDSVATEINKKITDTINFIGNIIKTTLITQLEDSRVRKHSPLSDPLTIDDIKTLENLFYGYHGAARVQGALTDPLSLIEEWIISFIACKLDQKTKITINELAKELVTSVLKMSVGVQDSFDNLITFENGFAKKKSFTVDRQMVSTVSNVELIGIHSPDSDHISRAIIYNYSTREKVVFVTLDYKTILNRRNALKAAYANIDCSDPLYAFHHLS